VRRIGDEARPALEIRDLELVLALAEAGSTVRAASKLHLTQSAVSRGLLVVEDKLGMPLFDRSPKGLAPTRAGAELIGGAGDLLGQLVELEQRTRSSAIQPLRVRVVCECYTAYRWLPSALASLRSRLDVEIGFEHTAHPVAALQSGEVDVALLTTSKIRAPLRELPLFADEIVFVVAASHALAHRPFITKEDLYEHTIISSSNTPQPELRWFANAIFGARAPALTKLHLPLTEAIIDATRAGMGVAVLSEWIASGYLDHTLVAKRMKKPLRRPWRLAFRPDAADRARQLAAAIGGLAPRLHA
jgi:LysR family transcriptional regulator for metE and metH